MTSFANPIDDDKPFIVHHHEVISDDITADSEPTGNRDKDKKGRFKKGNKASPGRVKGSKNRTTQAALELLEGEAESLTRKCIELALEGDIAALRLCLERIVPPSKERPLPALKLPTVETVTDIPKLTAAILQAVGNGEILPSQAHDLLRIAAIHGEVLSEFAPKSDSRGGRITRPPKAEEALRAILRGES